MPVSDEAVEAAARQMYDDVVGNGTDDYQADRGLWRREARRILEAAHKVEGEGALRELTQGEIRMAADALDFSLGYAGEEGLPGVEDARSALKKLRSMLTQPNPEAGG